MFRFISVLTAIACGVIYISLRVKLAFLFVLVTFLSNFGVASSYFYPKRQTKV